MIASIEPTPAEVWWEDLTYLGCEGISLPKMRREDFDADDDVDALRAALTREGVSLDPRAEAALIDYVAYLRAALVDAQALEALWDQAAEAAQEGDVERCLHHLMCASRIESEYGDDQMTRAILTALAL